MPTIVRSSGVRLDTVSDVNVTDLTVDPWKTRDEPPSRRRGMRLPTGPIPVATPGMPTADPIVESMLAQDLELVDAFEIAAPPAKPGTRAPPAVKPTALEAEVDEDEDAVVLLVQDGLYSWQFPAGASAAPKAATRRGAVVLPARKTVRFKLETPAEPGTAARMTRSGLSDIVVGAVRAYVFKFIARVAAKPVISFLERKVRTGLVVMDNEDATRWRRVDDFSALRLPQDRPARILLFVHGTFSSTLGSYGHLSGSDWGRAFLRAAIESYDAVVGYDHASLSVAPNENAADLLTRLEAAQTPLPLQIDSIAFSRGALVLRSFIEQVLPASRLDARVRRAVFVGGTNGGTMLASPERWEEFSDLYTNLASAGCEAFKLLAPAALASTILREAVQSLGAFVKYLSAAAMKDRAVPGLAAMWPDGDFVKEINRTQPGQPTAAESHYCVITSEFNVSLFQEGQGAGDLPARFARWMTGKFSSSLMKEASDLVVNTRSMSEIDPKAGVFVKERLDFGRNPHVYHTVYFTRPEVVKALTRWLQLEDHAPAHARRTRGSIVASPSSVMITDANADFAEVCGSIVRREPQYVIVERHDFGQTYRYAFRTEELLALDKQLPVELRKKKLTLRTAIDSDPRLELHEQRESPEDTEAGAVQASRQEGLTGRRQIAMEGTLVVGVIEPPEALPSIAELAQLQKRITRPVEPVPARPPTTWKDVEMATERDIESVPKVTFRKTRSTRGTRGPASAPSAPQPPPPPPAITDHDVLSDRIARKRAMPRMANGGSSAPTKAPPRTTYFAAASMPEEIPLARTVELEVTLSRDEIEIVAGSASAKTNVTLDESRQVAIEIVPKTQNVEIVGDDHVLIDPTSQRRHQLIFDVKGTQAGPAQILVRIRQGPPVLATLTLAPQVVAKARKDPARIADTASAGEPEAGLPLYSVLEIDEQASEDGIRFRFSLHLFEQGQTHFKRGCSKPLKMDRAAYVAALYEKIETRWVSSHEDVKAFERELRKYGGTLYDELVPAEIQQVLWENRDTLKAIQIMSEEPFIPWEILHLKEPSLPGLPAKPLPPQSHFFAEKGLVRWLWNRSSAPSELKLRKGRALYIVPAYPVAQYQLPAAQEEIPFLEKKLHAAPLNGNSNEVIERLSNPNTIDLLHFSGHGQAETESATQTKVMLTGRIEENAYVPDYLASDDVQQSTQLSSGQGGSRPLVVLNACQAGRVGWHLTELGGFAEAFLRQGAGAFVGALWEVGDTNARHFSEGFYAALLAGETLANAAKRGREAAKQAGEPSWLAYVVYGYPHAKLRVC